MALFYCVWSADASLLIDVADEAKAIEAATEEVGEAPSEVRAIPVGVVAMRVYFADDENKDDDELTLEPLPHVVELLGELEDACTPALAEEVPAPLCMSEADGDSGQIVRCELLSGHSTLEQHRAGDLRW